LPTTIAPFLDPTEPNQMQTTTNSPYFSVVLPTHNRAEMLREAIQSILNQTFTDFEVIVVDDHSSDHTAEVVASFADPRINYILNDHIRGGAGTRNAGIFRAKGEWVAFLDDDDLWLPEKLQLQYERILTASQDVGLVYSGYTVVIGDNRSYTRMAQKEGWLLQELLYHNFIAGFYSVVIRKDLLWAVNGLDEAFPASQDIELYIRIAQLSQIVCVKEPLVRVRMSHSERITSNFQKKLNGNVLLLNKYREFYAQSPRLTHRAQSKVFVFALLSKNYRYVKSSLLWTLLGVVLDPKNVLWIMRRVVASPIRRFLYRTKHCAQLPPLC
jgi:glycosyltransferase involved in cell wall biosynthesis